MSLGDGSRHWVEDALGSVVVAADPLSGGVASRMLLVRVEDGREAVLRQMVEDPWRAHAEALLTRERDVHVLLASGAVPAPRTLALDVRGDSTDGDPSLLMSRLPGRVDLVAARPESLAEALLAIHAVRPQPGEWPRRYESWAFESKRVVPPWSGDDGLYREAFARLAEPAPPYDETFLHRDFHPANVLRHDGRVTGVVDWVETSTGPADLDVAHCVTNLASLHGAEAARAFRCAYVDRGGVLERDPRASAYWQLLDLVAFLPGPSGRESGATVDVIERTWRESGRPDLRVDVARARREDLLRDVLVGTTA
ncbi:MAG: aminoglycoside phosphotransferase family protein [Nocardioidaceae bacterium]